MPSSQSSNLLPPQRSVPWRRARRLVDHARRPAAVHRQVGGSMPQTASPIKTTRVTPLSTDIPTDLSNGPPASPSGGQGQSSSPGAPRHVLEFEKPLSRLEQQILELENL